MSEDGGKLFKEVQTLEPLFKEEQKEEQVFQNQDQFLQQDQFQEVRKEVTEEKKTTLAQNLANSFVEAEKTQIKADKSDPQEPEPAYVSLHASNLAVTKGDSKKMAAVKEAVKKYQESKGTDEEGPALEAVVKACKSYAWGKFSLFSFGKSKVMLNEVKKVRQEAEIALLDLAVQQAAKEKQLIKEKEEAEKKALLKKVKDVRDGLTDDEGYNITLTKAESDRLKEIRTQELKERFPTLSQNVIDSILFREYKHDFIHTDEEIMERFMDEEAQEKHFAYMKEKEEKEKKKEEPPDDDRSFIRGISGSEIEPEIQRRYKKMNGFQKMYHKLLGMQELRYEVMKDWEKAFRFANDLEKKDEVKLSKNDTDYESTFI